MKLVNSGHLLLQPSHCRGGTNQCILIGADCQLLSFNNLLPSNIVSKYIPQNQSLHLLLLISSRSRSNRPVTASRMAQTNGFAPYNPDISSSILVTVLCTVYREVLTNPDISATSLPQSSSTLVTVQTNF